MANEKAGMAISSETCEQLVRYYSSKLGCSIHKSRKQESIDNHGEFQLIDSNKIVVMGARFDASLTEMLVYLWNKHEN